MYLKIFLSDQTLGLQALSQQQVQMIIICIRPSLTLVEEVEE